MYRACLSVLARVASAQTCAAALVVMALTAAAQGAMPGVESNAVAAAGVARGPLARLIVNPETSGGRPPFALTDQNGVIQRYVEPVPEIELEAYVGQVVVVRHDTGGTLLASQLELPPLPLRPLLGDAAAAARSRNSFVQQAQYADDDDATVELLDDDESLPNSKSLLQGSIPKGLPSPGPNQQGELDPDGGFPTFPPDAVMQGTAGLGGPYDNSNQFGPLDSGWMPDGSVMMPCPECGRYHQAPCPSPRTSQNRQPPTRYYGDVELNFLRLHMTEETIGKLSERYEFSPRFILGFAGLGPIDGRVRYWIYGEKSETLGDDEEELRLDFDVLDLEGTHQFCGKRSEVVLAAGVRLARIELDDVDDDEEDAKAGSDMIGLTLAADGRTQLKSIRVGRFAWVYGGRLSILGGDWGGDDDGFVDGRVRDDNMVVHELYAGLEFTRLLPSFDLRARLAFELQNWRSDVLASSDETDLESIGVVGPGLRIGAEF